MLLFVLMNMIMMRRSKRMTEMGCMVAIVNCTPVPVCEESGDTVVVVTLKAY